MPGRARLVVLPLLLASAAACSAQPGGTDGSSPGTTPALSTVSVSASPSASLTPLSSEPAPTASARATTTGPASSVSSSAAACTGTAGHQAFFTAAARELKWDVYCAVLPDGWFLNYAQYAGDQLTATYKGPGNVHLQLQEGSYCVDDPTSCQPRGTEVGPTLFGDKSGTLYALNPGYAVYVNPGTDPPSWAAASVDLDESLFVKLVAQLHRVVP